VIRKSSVGVGESDSKCLAFGIKNLFGGRERQHSLRSKDRARFSAKRLHRQKGADLNRHQQLSRAGRRVADATQAAAKFKPTVDGKQLVRQFEVHGMVVTEWVNVADAAKPRK